MIKTSIIQTYNFLDDISEVFSYLLPDCNNNNNKKHSTFIECTTRLLIFKIIK